MGIIRLKEWLRGTKTGKGEVSLALVLVPGLALVPVHELALALLPGLALVPVPELALALVPGLALVPVPELALAWMLDPDLDPDSDS